MDGSPRERPVDDFGWLDDVGVDVDRLHPRRLPRSEGELSAIAWGEDPFEVLYLHGSGQNAHTWDLAAALVGHPAIAVDLPGHGHSAWHPEHDYHPKTNAAAVAVLSDELGLRPRLVVGMSLGGLTALALAELRPELVPNLVLVDILPGVEEAMARMTRVDLGQVALLAGPAEFESLEAMEDATIAAAGGSRSAESLRRGVWHNAERGDDGVWRWRYDREHARGGPSSELLWPAVRAVPTVTLVKGGRSPFVGEEALTRLSAERPATPVHVAPDSGHAVQSDAAPLLAAVVSDALSA
ncbi:alpha/beta fold hydrolase [Rathayibacter sp. CAU 1779]